jgi:hypothetical protein
VRTVGAREVYAHELRHLGAAQWPGYLGEHSGLPGPRGNIELAQAVADVGVPAFFDRLIDTDEEYLVFCGVVGLGRELAEDADTDEARAEAEHRLRGHATDARWRVREAVAMALQRLGDADLSRLLDVVRRWAGSDDPLVLRAAAAAICEPRLLRDPAAAAVALQVCGQATRALVAVPADRRHDPDVRTLRQGLGYCWSVAVAADPDEGLPRFRALSNGPAGRDPDVVWIVRENSAKARLARLL